VERVQSPHVRCVFGSGLLKIGFWHTSAQIKPGRPRLRCGDCSDARGGSVSSKPQSNGGTEPETTQFGCVAGFAEVSGCLADCFATSQERCLPGD
jgi:hypothetical protein